ncbi:MAG: DUF885 domain-containing protein [Gammaproteobacteria bacterium]|nr:DUF885 domain-containing protein [Gammaproteobacteria bacterium]
MRPTIGLCFGLLAGLAAGVGLAASPGDGASPPPPKWIAESNAEAGLLIEAFARFYPEYAGQFGAEGIDTRIVDLGPAISDRRRAAFTAVARELDERKATVTDPRVVQDLEILRQEAQLRAAVEEADQRYLLPVVDVAEQVYSGVRALLTDQVAAERYPAAAIRLQRYAGLEEGYTALATLAEARTREQLGAIGLLFPARAQLEQQLANSSVYLDGVAELLDQYKVKGGDKPLKELRKQVAAYDDFLRRDVLPRARDDFRLPPELYGVRLRETGVDIPPAELAARARTSFMEIRNQMVALAPLVAREQGLDATGYPAVIRALRTRQVAGDATLPLYRQRLAALEDIIRREHIVSLPRAEAIIRLATPAESAAVPSPQMQPPPFINNRGERGEFVLPLAVPSADGTTTNRLEDFTFDAATWTLTAHEARPGHELQFASMVENGVSLARALFAFNSVNVEGWALYAEAEVQPYLPLEGQLIALQFRLLRAARAFLDPGLQLGTITLDEARRVLVDEVVLTEANAEQELQRYTFRAPGQATSYFWGYQQLLDVRAGTEIALGSRFDRQRFHDFVLAQGVLPPALLRTLVQAEFIPAADKAR